MSPRGLPSLRELTIYEAAKGSRRDLLVALRDRIATALQNPTIGGRDLASLSLRLLELVKELELLDVEAGGDRVGNAAATPDEQWVARRDGDVRRRSHDHVP